MAVPLPEIVALAAVVGPSITAPTSLCPAIIVPFTIILALFASVLSLSITMADGAAPVSVLPVVSIVMPCPTESSWSYSLSLTPVASITFASAAAFEGYKTTIPPNKVVLRLCPFEILRFAPSSTLNISFSAASAEYMLYPLRSIPSSLSLATVTVVSSVAKFTS